MNPTLRIEPQPVIMERITKRFGTMAAVDDVTITAEAGQLTTLLGPSGCGKTTTLRMIGGFYDPDEGTIRIGDRQVNGVPPHARSTRTVFQSYALFPHMTVFENVAFGLRVKKRAERPSREAIRSRVMELLKMVQIDWLADRLPNQLSGGQRQRAALARALAVEPKVLLLDEPFGALDAKVRKELRRWLRRLHDEIHVTSVFVTHDVDEALEVADEVVVMNQARIEQVGPPDDVYENPVNAFVYHFLGSVNVFHSRRDAGQAHRGGDANADRAADPDKVAHARPHDIDIVREPAKRGWFTATVVRIHAIGPIVRVELQRHDDQSIVEAELTHDVYRAERFIAGESVSIRPRQFKIYEPVNGRSSENGELP